MMKKATTKLLSLILALVMASSAMCLSVLAESKYAYKKVTLIGDSIATALRMEWRGEGAPPEDIKPYYRYNEGSGLWTRTGATHGTWIENSWPARVVRGVGLNEKDLYNYGREAFSSIEFRRMLDASYSPSAEDLAISDGLYAEYGADLQGRGLNYIQSQIPKDLADSDLVLLGMGSNDIFSYAMVHYSNVTAGLETTPLNKAQLQALEAIDGVVSTLVSQGLFAEAWAKIIATAKTVNALEQTLLIMVKVILQGVQKFLQNWDVIIDKIHAYNPDATVMAVSLFNATEGIYLTDSIKLDLGQIMKPVFDTMNNHMKSYAKKTGYYTYVDCTKTSHPGWPTAMEIVQDTSQLMVYMMLCTHPDYDGQNYMANQVLAALPEKDKKTENAAGSLNGLAKGSDGRWAMYKDDRVNTSYTGLVKQPANGVWYYVENGYVNWNYSGFVKNEKGWWRVKDGRVDFSANSIYKQPANGVWYKATNGHINWNENSIYKNENGWWKCTNSRVTFKETGIYGNEYGIWYVLNSKVDFSKNGPVKVNGKTYTVKAGRVIA
ncbi:MAG: hypothetical protein IJ720_00735 [Clostridia bacterium]|nr:hypothetical protein [Clostridia bacterium]